MNTHYLSIFLTLLCLPTLQLHAGVAKGDTKDAVVKELGEPIGLIEIRNKMLLLYPEGEITLKNDQVVDIDLLSPEEYAAEQAALKAEREAWLQDQEIRQARRAREAEIAKNAILSDPAYSRLSAQEKLERWKRFQQRFPEFDNSEQLASAAVDLREELEDLKEEQRIIELEGRVARAELEAARAQQSAGVSSGGSVFVGRTGYAAPRYFPRSGRGFRGNYYRPPSVTIFGNGENSFSNYKPNNYRLQSFNSSRKLQQRSNGN